MTDDLSRKGQLGGLPNIALLAHSCLRCPRREYWDQNATKSDMQTRCTPQRASFCSRTRARRVWSLEETGRFYSTKVSLPTQGAQAPRIFSHLLLWFLLLVDQVSSTTAPAARQGTCLSVRTEELQVCVEAIQHPLHIG